MHFQLKCSTLERHGFLSPCCFIIAFFKWVIFKPTCSLNFDGQLVLYLYLILYNFSKCSAAVGTLIGFNAMLCAFYFMSCFGDFYCDTGLSRGPVIHWMSVFLGSRSYGTVKSCQPKSTSLSRNTWTSHFWWRATSLTCASTSLSLPVTRFAFFSTKTALCAWAQRNTMHPLRPTWWVPGVNSKSELW